MSASDWASARSPWAIQTAASRLARLEALDRLLGLPQPHGCFVESSLVEQRAPEHDLDAADLVEHILAAREDLQRVARLWLRELRVAGAQVHLGERRDRIRGIDVVGTVEPDRDRLLEVGDRLLRLSEQEVDPAEVVQHLPDVGAVTTLLVQALGLLGVEAREQPLAFSLVDDGETEVDVRGEARVAERLDELERVLDVRDGGVEVALVLVGTGAPLEDLGTQPVARATGALTELQGEREVVDGPRVALRA